MAVSNSACDSHETHNKYPNLNAVPLSATPLNDQQRFRLNKVNEIEDSFVAEISERELTSKRLCKCIVSFEYFDKSLIFFIRNNQQPFYCIICNCCLKISRNSNCEF